MSVPKGLARALAVARVAILLALLPYALDWRSPFLASIRVWAVIGIIAIPLAIVVTEVRALRRGVDCFDRVLSSAALALSLLCLVYVSWWEAQFWWKRHEVLRADPALLERLGRHVVVGYRDIEELKLLIERRAIAGVFLTARNVRGRDVAAIRQEIADMQAERGRQGLPELLVTTDQEGGVVSRLSPPLAPMPPLSEIVARHSVSAERRKAVRNYAAAQARDLADLGVNVNLAPVVDLDYGIVNPSDRLTRISTRAISADPHIVTEVAEDYCSQLLHHGVRCTLKHFPGLGRVVADTHLESADLALPPHELAGTDWLPFRSLMHRHEVIVMLGHARLTAVDAVRPASFSQPVVRGVLRTDWGYDGLLLTDDFSMGAVTGSAEGIGGGSVEALNAGVDLILVSYDPDQFYMVLYALISAARAGVLRTDLLDQSDQRLAKTWAHYKTWGR
jgi:beta-N-acetylhexosaminidase